MQPGMPAAAGAVFGLVWFVFMMGVVIVWIVLLVAVWRAMKAHESIADSLNSIASTLAAKRIIP